MYHFVTVKRFSFSDIGFAIVNDINYCKHFPFLTKDQAINKLEKIKTKSKSGLECLLLLFI